MQHNSAVLFVIATSWLAPSGVLAQTKVLKVSGVWDAASAPGANPLPGFRGAAREQVLIGESRLIGLRGKKLAAVQFRRDLDKADFIQGGKIDFTVRLSTSMVAPRAAREAFAVNAPSQHQSLVFSGTVTVPNSPSLSPSRSVWSNLDSVTIPFSQKFVYAGGTLCIDIEGIPQKVGEPSQWYADHEYVPSGGRVRAFGSSCSSFSANGKSLTAESNGLQVGGSIRVLAFGRPGSSPVLLMGASALQPGIDLTGIGARGCRQYVSPFVSVPLQYRTYPYMDPAVANFTLHIPANRVLIGAGVFLQAADIETRLPNWTNAAGLTTTNGLELELSSVAPTLGMSVVRSDEVDIGSPLPTTGRVEVERAPVVRLLYEN